MTSKPFSVRLITGLVTRGAVDWSTERNGLRSTRPEGLRASSLRGGMRYWFRALAGAAFRNGHASTVEERTAVTNLEGSLFGTTSHRSLFSIEVLAVVASRPGPIDLKPDGTRRKPGLAAQPAGPAVVPEFTVNFRFHPWCEPDQQAAILECWRVLCLLSGDGLRKRRGIGSIDVVQEFPPGACAGPLALADLAAAYAGAVSAASGAIRKLLPRLVGIGTPPEERDKWPALSAQLASVWLVAPAAPASTPHELWATMYDEVYTTYKAPLRGQLGRRYGDREGALPSPFLFTIKEWPVGVPAPLTYGVIAVWHHDTHVSVRPQPYFADAGGAPWGRLAAHLNSLRPNLENVQVPL